jgi:hypothetical protein
MMKSELGLFWYQFRFACFKFSTWVGHKITYTSSNTCCEIVGDFKPNVIWTCSLHVHTSKHGSNQERVMSYAMAPVNGCHEISPGDSKLCSAQSVQRDLQAKEVDRLPTKVPQLLASVGMNSGQEASSNLQEDSSASGPTPILPFPIKKR